MDDQRKDGDDSQSLEKKQSGEGTTTGSQDPSQTQVFQLTSDMVASKEVQESPEVSLNPSGQEEKTVPPPFPEIPDEMPESVQKVPAGTSGRAANGPALLWALVAVSAVALVMVLVWLSSRSNSTADEQVAERPVQSVHKGTSETLHRDSGLRDAEKEDEEKPEVQVQLSPECWVGRASLPAPMNDAEGEASPVKSVDVGIGPDWEAWVKAVEQLAGPVGAGGARSLGSIRLEDFPADRKRPAYRRLTLPGLTVLSVPEGQPLLAKPRVPFPDVSWWREQGWDLRFEDQGDQRICRMMRQANPDNPKDHLGVGSGSIAGFTINQPSSTFRNLPTGWSLVERSNQFKGVVYDSYKLSDEKGNHLGYLYGKGDRLVAVDGISPLLRLDGLVRVGDTLRQVLGLGRNVSVKPLGQKALMVGMVGDDVKMLLEWDPDWKNPETLKRLSITRFFLGWPPNWEKQ